MFEIEESVQPDLKRRKIEEGEAQPKHVSDSSVSSNDPKYGSDSSAEAVSSDVDLDPKQKEKEDRIRQSYKVMGASDDFIEEVIRSLRIPHVSSDEEEDELDPQMWEEYCRQIDETEGFGLRLDLGNHGSVSMRPIPNFKELKFYSDLLPELANFAIEEYNRINAGKEFKFIDLEWVVVRQIVGWLYYLTFKAEDKLDGVKIFEAKVLDGLMHEKHMEVHLIRIKADDA